MSKQKLAEGKTKIIWSTGYPNIVRIESKDDITAGDGAKHDVLTDKALAATETTCNVFELLRDNQIRTHYINRVDDRTFEAYNAMMIPLELVARRIATGSYLKRRPDVVEGTVFDSLVVEFFEKDDANHDPLLIVDPVSRRLLRYTASKPLAEGFMGEVAWTDLPWWQEGLFKTMPQRIQPLADTVRKVFRILEQAWATQDVQLVDLKIECGFLVKDGTPISCQKRELRASGSDISSLQKAKAGKDFG
jgi:phosphoribosylaminoimidazole-succinocarboxamide synthase